MPILTDMRASLHWTPSDLPFTETYQHGQAREPVQTQVWTSLCVEKYSRLRWRGGQGQGIGQHQSDRARNDLGWDVTQAGRWQWHNWESQSRKALPPEQFHKLSRISIIVQMQRHCNRDKQRKIKDDIDRRTKIGLECSGKLLPVSQTTRQQRGPWNNPVCIKYNLCH